MKTPVTRPELSSWDALNAALMKTDEQTCLDLLEQELAGRRRTMFALRIHSRINKLRADRERAELREKLR